MNSVAKKRVHGSKVSQADDRGAQVEVVVSLAVVAEVELVAVGLVAVELVAGDIYLLAYPEVPNWHPEHFIYVFIFIGSTILSLGLTQEEFVDPMKMKTMLLSNITYARWID